jgi:hypothetical protein
MLARFGLLVTAIPTVVLAQVINRPSNDRPAESSNTTYIVIAVVVVVVVGAFLYFRSQNKK